MRYCVSIKGVLRSPQGAFVLHRNEREESELPGGQIEIGESSARCLAREIEEELGLRVRVGSLLDTSATSTSSWGASHSWIFHEDFPLAIASRSKPLRPKSAYRSDRGFSTRFRAVCVPPMGGGLSATPLSRHNGRRITFWIHTESRYARYRGVTQDLHHPPCEG